MPRQISSGIAIAAAALVAIILTGCNGNGGPTAPESSSLVLTSATVSVNGQVLNGETLPRGHGEGVAERFEAVLEKDGVRVTGGTVRVQHDSPGGMMMGSPVFHLYDDGTHGDRMPNDGLYCFEDFQGQYGCHTEQASRGSHHYDFAGMDSQGHKSSQMRVTVTIR
jgi:hypothetical protein